MAADSPGEGSWAAQCRGNTLFIKNEFVYNILCRDLFTVVADTDVPVGGAALGKEIEPTGEPDLAARKRVAASGQHYLDGELVGAVDMPHTGLNVFSTEGRTCGHDGDSVVATDADRDAFGFAGSRVRAKLVAFTLSEDLIVDTATDLKVVMAHQSQSHLTSTRG